jgi:predicted nucleic acid-binding protein
MGAVVDTSVFVAHERRGLPGSALRAALQQIVPQDRLVFSSISLAELVHGIYRAATVEQHAKRRAFVKEVSEAFPIIPFTTQTAWMAGRIRGEQAKLGNTLPLADSFIAATALRLDYAVLTSNLSDFVRVPDLRVIPFVL